MTQGADQDTPTLEFGRFTILARLGGGGMADVFLATEKNERDALLVVKVLKRQLAEDDRFVRMFLSEADIAARLLHPNIVRTFSVETDQGDHGIVMEYLQGATLRQLLTRLEGSSFEQRKPLVWVIDRILSALEYMHAFSDPDGTPLRLVHRDIKPANIIATGTGAVKVLDFGISKAFAVQSGERTATTEFKGTFRYSPHEAINRDSENDRRVDVYGVGCLLWEVLSGMRAWEGLEDIAIVKAIVARERMPMSLPEDVPESLYALCYRAVDPNPMSRLASATEFRAELFQCLGETELKRCQALLPELVKTSFGDELTRRTQFVEDMRYALRASGDLRADVDTLARLPDTPPPEERDRETDPPSYGSTRPRRRRGVAIGLAVGTMLAAAGTAAWLQWFAG